jgi:hypothetical protein
MMGVQRVDYLTTEPFAKAIREVARLQHNLDKRHELMAQADVVDYVVQLFEGKPSLTNAQYVTGAMARAWAVLGSADPIVDDNGTAGAMPVQEVA